MWEAGMWGVVAGSALLAGALVSLVVRVPLRVIGLVVGFGSGVLISAVAFELTDEAIQVVSLATVSVAMLAGAGVYLTGDWAVSNLGAHRRKSPVHGGIRADEVEVPAPARSTVQVAGISGAALVVGALLDGLPESAAIGVGLSGGEKVAFAFVAAVFLSNVPEGMAATAGLKASGRTALQILTLWTSVIIASGIAAMIGFVVLGDAGPTALGTMLSFAAGGVLAMVATTMLPEAVEHAGRYVGLVTVIGFAVAVVLGEL